MRTVMTLRSHRTHHKPNDKKNAGINKGKEKPLLNLAQDTRKISLKVPTKARKRSIKRPSSTMPKGLYIPPHI